MMKHAKEYRVAILAIIAAFLLYFGFNYLKGINIFHKTNEYVVRFSKMNGLVEQSPVYVQGYKVGIVDKISYDFSLDCPFTVTFSINRDIEVPYGSTVALVADGLISGEALELRIPTVEVNGYYLSGDTLPSQIEPDIISGVTAALAKRMDPILHSLDSILAVVQGALDEQQLKSILGNVDATIENTKTITKKVDGILADELPVLIDSIKFIVSDLHQVSSNIADADLRGVILKLDTTVNGVNTFLQNVNSTDGTIGMLINDKELYVSLNNTVLSADSLLTDLKAHPKRYVHFSLFGKKEN